MGQRPELSPARRRRTVMTICAYLNVKNPTPKQIDLLSDVLLTGELDFTLACHRMSLIERSVPRATWWDVLVEGLQAELAKLSFLQESFWIHSKTSEAVLYEIKEGVKPCAPLVE